EFLWQEGHCVYESKEDCDREVQLMLEEYRKLCEDVLAIPVLTGYKSKAETFAGALYTTTLEALMPDGKALQLGTSHNLGQGFAKAFGIEFLGRDEEKHVPWQSSWGFSTRLIGALVMVHGDDKGLILPPRIASVKAVVVPIVFDKGREAVLAKARELAQALSKAGIACHLDDRDEYSAGWKFNEWELKGVPLRVEVGPKDVEKKQCVLVRRDTGEKAFVKETDLVQEAGRLLDAVQAGLLARAKKFRDENTVEAKSYADFQKAIEARKLVKAFFCEQEACEKKIKEETTATSRCIPFNQSGAGGKCVKCGSPAKRWAYFAKNY
ncbi:MAG TPA: proline--tRNA ligase, partial [Candidatus Diapherotrites archaeon]|nr:proline--tRNA ligase [Candidatus Diapherotrites archaeon]